MNAGDSLLTDVAPLGIGDRAQLVEVGFLWQRRIIDINSPLRPTTLDARDLPGLFGPGRNAGSMEARLAKVEAAVEHIQTDIGDVKTDVREIRAKIDANFLITWGGLIAAVLGLGALMAKGFKWI